MSKSDMPEMGSQDNPEVENAATGIWFSTAHDIFEHHVIGAHVRAPAPADPSRAVWQPLVLWLWMIREAGHKDEMRKLDGRKAFVPRGSILASQRYLCVHANWNRKAMRLFLARLVKHKMITIDVAEPGSHLDRALAARGPIASIITICNYSRYQHLGKRRGPRGAQLGPNKGPVRAQSTTVDKDTTDREIVDQSPPTTVLPRSDARKEENLAAPVIDLELQRVELSPRARLLIGEIGSTPVDEFIRRARNAARKKGERIGAPDVYCVAAALREIDPHITAAVATKRAKQMLNGDTEPTPLVEPTKKPTLSQEQLKRMSAPKANRSALLNTSHLKR